MRENDNDDGDRGDGNDRWGITNGDRDTDNHHPICNAMVDIINESDRKNSHL
jgi:hypothetical protein